MSESIKTKVDLNKVTHSVRAAQAVLQYGVGAMVDFPDQTLVTAAPEYWGGVSRIYDHRFAKALCVHNTKKVKDLWRIPAFAFLYLLGNAEKHGYRGNLE